MDESEKHTLHHFSHQHPLERTISSSTGHITCCGCSLRISPSKEYYDCKTCSFSLHKICSKMPRKTRHPAHPTHYLTLLVSPPSAADNSSFNYCQACGDHVFGFYYNCAECEIYYHILCSSLPLSVAISSHPHTLKVEFSPPYDFSCDVCNKPSHKGWLYRCRFCEFDAHICCAISNQRTHPEPPPNSLTRQITYSSSAFVMEVNRMIDYGIGSKELMQLLLQGVSRDDQDRINQEFACSTAVAGWDERLRSPKQSNGTEICGIGRFRLDHQTEAEMSSTSGNRLDRPRNKDSSTNSMSAEDLMTISSYQNSDMCFSIDLLKSFSSQDLKLHANKEEGNANSDPGKMVSKKTSGNSQQVQQQHPLDYPNKPVFNPLYKAPENWLQNFEELSFGGFSGEFGQYLENGYGAKPIEHSSTKSKKSNRICSCWRKIFSCFYYPRYKKCSKSFKNGGL